MKARVKTFTIDVEPMNKFEYNSKIKNIAVQHLENKRVDGYCCNWNGYIFWLSKDDFDKMYTIEDVN